MIKTDFEVSLERLLGMYNFKLCERIYWDRIVMETEVDEAIFQETGSVSGSRRIEYFRALRSGTRECGFVPFFVRRGVNGKFGINYTVIVPKQVGKDKKRDKEGYLGYNEDSADEFVMAFNLGEVVYFTYLTGPGEFEEIEIAVAHFFSSTKDSLYIFKIPESSFLFPSLKNLLRDLGRFKEATAGQSREVIVHGLLQLIA